jgi:multiple antibiotic resistance protein
MTILINTFITLLIVLDPIGVAPIFGALTSGSTPEHRRRMAIRGTALAAGILLTFFFIGDRLLSALGIGIPAFRIAGGILFFLLAIDMVFARQSGLRSTTVQEQVEAAHKADVSVFPLAFPLIAGPGAMTTVLLMTSAKTDPYVFAGMLAVLVFVLSLTLVSLLMASKIMTLLGETGVNVLSRLFGVVLAALAVQFVLDGLKSSFALG